MCLIYNFFTMVHLLKISPGYFTEVESGRKLFEVRLNDRDFHKGDVIILTEYDSVNNCFTGRVLYAIAGVVYSLNGMDLLCDGVCVFALLSVTRLK